MKTIFALIATCLVALGCASKTTITTISEQDALQLDKRPAEELVAAMLEKGIWVAVVGNDVYALGIAEAKDLEMATGRAEHTARVRLSLFLNQGKESSGFATGAFVAFASKVEWRKIKQDGQGSKVTVLMSMPYQKFRA